MDHVFIPYNWKKYTSLKTFMEFPIHVGKWIDSWVKGGKIKPVRQSF